MLRILPSRLSSSWFCSTCWSNNVPAIVSSFQRHSPVLLQSSNRNFHKAPVSLMKSWFTPREDVTFWGRTLKKLGFTSVPKSALKGYGTMLYMKITDEMEYMKFFKLCDLPDTYASWFTVLELHVWLLCARSMQDGDEGKIVRNAIIKAMWDDNDLKSKRLEGALPSARRKEIGGLNDQFHAAILSYDEGLVGDDYILAGALWRRFFRLNDEDQMPLSPEKFQSAASHDALRQRVKALEMLVIFVRTQYYVLNNLSREQLLRKRAFKFASFDDSLYELAEKMEKSSTRKVESVRR